MAVQLLNGLQHGASCNSTCPPFRASAARRLRQAVESVAHFHEPNGVHTVRVWVDGVADLESTHG